MKLFNSFKKFKRFRKSKTIYLFFVNFLTVKIAFSLKKYTILQKRNIAYVKFFNFSRFFVKNVFDENNGFKANSLKNNFFWFFILVNEKFSLKNALQIAFDFCRFTISWKIARIRIKKKKLKTAKLITRILKVFKFSVI